MSIHRSYLSKSSTLIENELSNNSRNPVTEISYGGEPKQVSRYIFDIDLTDLTNKIEYNDITQNRVLKHILHFTNTINNADQYIGKKSYNLNTERATSFELDIINIDEDWDDGGGYDLIFHNDIDLNKRKQAVNWTHRKTNTPWTTEGYYLSGQTEIIDTTRFEYGGENLTIDVTDYINERLFVGTGTTYGLGLKFTDDYEDINTEYRQAVAFHTKYTNTFYHPYLETIIDDTVLDDRHIFHMDKINRLYLYINNTDIAENITINSVTVYDYLDEEYAVLTGNSINKVLNGIYYIELSVDSDIYPDSVLFRDVWNFTYNTKTNTHEDTFYLIPQNQQYMINSGNISYNNYHLNLIGIKENEKINVGDKRKVIIDIKQMYEVQHDKAALNIEYSLYTKIDSQTKINIIPFSAVNRTNNGYEFNVDTSWLIPQDYYVDVRISSGSDFKTMKTLSFSVIDTSKNLF